MKTVQNIIRFTFFICMPALIMLACTNSEPVKKYRIGFSNCTGGDAWRRQMVMSMRGELAFHPEIGLEYRDAENSNENQIRHINELIDLKVDLLIVSPNEADPVTPAVERAFQSGIPVIIIDRRTSSSLYTAYIGADNYAIGKLVGSYVADFLKYDGTILEIWGRRGSSPAIDRHRGFSEVIARHPGIKVVGEIDGMWELDTARNQLSKRMKELPRPDLIFAHNDVMAYAAHLVYRDSLENNKIAFIGIDALPGPGAGIQFVDDGILDATFMYPTGGEEAVRIATQILNGQPFQKENILHSTVVDSKNVRVMKLQTDKLLTQQKDIVRQQEKINEQIQIYYSQRILIYILLGSLVLMIIGAAVAVKSWQEKNEANKRLQAKGAEILEQRNTIAAMAEKAEIATQEKLSFFTNISHEFKTPLTLILGPIEELLAKGGDHRTNLKENLLLIQKNTLRLLRLVNQLMDFRKIEDKKMIVRASENDLVEFVKDVMNAFEKVARKRRIDFQLHTDINNLSVWFDPDMLDKVIFNLLSNAFKFTGDKGRIHISISPDELNKNAVIVVEDNGIGMTKEYLEHAFDRFYTGQNYHGTGIGLSLSKEFIELHHGELVLNSEKGRGTRFLISLPLGSSHFDEHQLVATENWLRKPDYDLLAEDILDPDTGTHSEAETQKDHTVLVIDDNAELRSFLSGRLKNFYNIVQAHDGITGLHLAFESVPDIIICDVMLPGMDGFEVARKVKADVRTSHIPVIILTAKASLDQKITGVQTGADEYITKPFNFDFLYEKMKSLIRSREALREHYTQDLNISPSPTAGGTLDRKFLNNFTSLIEKNINNPDFSVNEIGKELGMSRVQVYRKVKALLGMSLNDYVVNARLKKARYLLLNSNRSVSEVAAEVGFSSSSYFSTAFKAKFNMSPKDFKASQKAP